MNKILSIFIIFISFLCIFLNLNKLKTDIFDILDFSDINNQKEIIMHLNNNLSNSIMIFTKELENVEKINEKLRYLDITESENIDLDNIKEELNRLKLATLDDFAINYIINNPKDFIIDSLKRFYMPDNMNILGYKNDFFNISSHSKLNKQDIRLDASTMQLKIDDFFVIRVKIKEKNNDKLLEIFEYVVSFNDTYIQSPAIYAAKSLENGKQESTLFSLISIILSVFLLILAFNNIKIFYLVLIIFLSISSAIAMSFIFLDEVHILSLVISSSLIGLVLDFSMHFLSLNIEKKLDKSSIKTLKTVFLVGFAISTSGYLVFLFSEMNFLKQIAFIGMFSLLFAFIYTYFLLPNFIAETVFSPIKIYKIFTIRYIKILNFLKNYFVYILCFLSLFSIYEIGVNYNRLFVDDIKEFAKLDNKLEENTKGIAKIIKQYSLKFILLDDFDDQQKISQNGFFGALNFINSEKTQNKLKEQFRQLSEDDDFLRDCEKYGFKKEILKQELLKLSMIKTLSYDELLQFNMLYQLKNFKILDKYILFVKSNETIDDIGNYKVIDYIKSINQSFIKLKQKSIELKFIAFLIAFAILLLIYKKRSFIMFYCVLLSSFVSLSIFLFLDINPDIFSIFGFILGSIVGIDYIIFSQNKKLSVYERIYGIKLAALSSIISFCVLTLSNTQAVFSFGLSVSLNMFFAMLFASVLALLHR